MGELKESEAQTMTRSRDKGKESGLGVHMLAIKGPTTWVREGIDALMFPISG